MNFPYSYKLHSLAFIVISGNLEMFCFTDRKCCRLNTSPSHFNTELFQAVNHNPLEFYVPLSIKQFVSSNGRCQKMTGNGLDPPLNIKTQYKMSENTAKYPILTIFSKLAFATNLDLGIGSL